MDGPQLGQWVVVNGSLFRSSQWVHGKGMRREWVHVSYPKDTKGLVIGKRTLSNGIACHEKEYDGYGNYVSTGVTTWTPDEYVTAYLVVTNLHEKPFHVRLDQIAPLLS